MRVLVGCDHAGVPLRAAVEEAALALGHEVERLGAVSVDSPVDYPDVAHEAAARVVSGEASFGILVCGSGVGMAIAANRHRGVRAVVCSEPYSARMARAHNDANMLCFGARVVGSGVARTLVEVFLTTSFEGGRHVRRVEKIDRPE